MQILVITTILLSIALFGMAFNLIFRKKDFPETHVGHNREMKKRKIVCAKTMDKMERRKLKNGFKYQNLSLDTSGSDLND
jgi:uncharacterized Rossmann fold enzyme